MFADIGQTAQIIKMETKERKQFQGDHFKRCKILDNQLHNIDSSAETFLR